MRQILIFLIFLAAPAWAQPSDAPGWWGRYRAGVQAVTLPDGRKLNMFCEGSGGPVVVLESGLGTGAWAWRKVQGGVAHDARVCSYSRAGFFGSSPAKDNRDASAAADDLAALLKAAKLPAPYVLVGHSYGGLIVRLFASRHPDQIAGLVLLDPSGEFQKQRIEAVVPPAVPALSENENLMTRCTVAPRPASLEGKCLLRPVPTDLPAEYVDWYSAAQDPAYAQAVLGETRAMPGSSSEQVKAEKKNIGPVPMLLLEQGNGFAMPGLLPAEAEALWTVWHQMHVEMLGISRASELLIVPHTGHNIQAERPDAVIAGVAAVLKKARAATTQH